MVRIFLVVRITAILLLKTTCVFGNSCDCELIKDVLTKEIFDLKIENRQLTSRMDQMESLLHSKTSEMSPATELDTARSHLIDTRISDIESKIQETTSYSKKSMHLHNLIAKGFRAEKSERLRNELKIEAGLKKINASLKELNLQSDAISESLKIKLSDYVRVIKSETSQSIASVRNDVAGISNKVTGLEHQTNDLDKRGIKFVEETMVAIKQDVSRLETDVNAIIDMVILDQKAICQPNCSNDGVCFKDNICKCKPLTEGTRCEIAICDEKCRENDGECISPGICKCPEGRLGLNCDKKGCILPDNAANNKEGRTVFSPGETLTAFSCDIGYIVWSRNGITCLDDGSWSEIMCEKAVHYIISVKTAAAFSDGTEAEVYITLHGNAERTHKIYLNGTFEPDQLDETRVEAMDIRPISSVVVGHDGSGIFPGWYLEYVSIYVENMEEYYVFRKRNGPVLLTGDSDVVLPREDEHRQCINTFDKGNKWYPKLSVIGNSFLDLSNRRRIMSLRGCKQECINLKNSRCQAVHYNTITKKCTGITVTGRHYYSERLRTWDSLVYLRICETYN